MVRRTSDDGSLKKTAGKKPSRSAAANKGGGAEEKKSPVISLRHLRLRVRDIETTDALATQRETPWPDLSRRIYQRGCQIEAACGPPDVQGNYGTYTGARLAQLLAADVDTLITFQMRHGQVPAVIQVLLDIVRRQGKVPAPIATMQAEGESVRAAVGPEELTDVEEGAVATLDLFFGSEQS